MLKRIIVLGAIAYATGKFLKGAGIVGPGCRKRNGKGGGEHHSFLKVQPGLFHVHLNLGPQTGDGSHNDNSATNKVASD